jgi:hypothetical protein
VLLDWGFNFFCWFLPVLEMQICLRLAAVLNFCQHCKTCDKVVFAGRGLLCCRCAGAAQLPAVSWRGAQQF